MFLFASLASTVQITASGRMWHPELLPGSVQGFCLLKGSSVLALDGNLILMGMWFGAALPEITL